MKRKQNSVKKQKATGQRREKQSSVDRHMEKFDVPQATPETVHVTKAMERSLEKADMPQENEKRGSRYKVWIEIERLKPNGDQDRDYAAPLPDCVGTADSEKKAMARVWEIVSAFGVDPENSDCKPRGQRRSRH